MQTTHRLNKNPVVTWWISARPIFSDLSRFVEISPLTIESTAGQAAKICNLYRTISAMDYPEEVNEVYDHITQALLHLFKAYEAAMSGNWTQSELFFGYAVSEWIYAKSACCSVGIGRIQ